MVAFNFKEQFVSAIKQGTKTQTIRQSIRCKEGDILQLYTGMRTKQCKKIKDTVCEFIYPITITEDKLSSRRTQLIRKQDLNNFARKDGFKDYEELKAFFKTNYGLPFSGYVYTFK
jgi:hypothetical protein